MVIIKKCHVDNFGKISDFDFCFQEGINIIKEDNAWGKTTFSVFIKAMFYGLEYNSKRKNERKQYEPWQGGVFGGSMILDINGREYRIERTFGKKDKDDTFALYNLQTGKASDDYTDKLGEELFQIDRDSFMKSIYIPQCNTDTEMTDSINAKIGNLAQVKDDISNYEAVVKMLEEKKKEYSGRGKKTRYSELISDISELKSKLEMRQELENEVILLKMHLQNKEQNLKEIRKEREKCNQIYLEHSKKIADTAIYKEIQKNLKDTKQRINHIRGKYKKEIELEDIKILKRETDSINNLRSQLEYIRENGMGSSSDVISAEERFDELNRFFGENIPSKEEILEQIDNYNRAEQMRKEIVNQETELHNNKVRLSSTFKILFSIGIFFIAAGIIIEFFNTLIGTIAIATGVFPTMVGILAAYKERNKIYDNILKKTGRMKVEAEEFEKRYLNFVSQFKTGHQENVINVLMEIKEKKDEFEELTYILSEDKKRKEAIHYRIAGHVKNYNDLKNTYSDEQEFRIDIMENDFYEIQRENKNIAALQEKLDRLKDSIHEESGEVLSVEELNENLKKMDSQIHIILEDINRHKRDLEKKYESLEENEFLEEELEKKQEELMECKEKTKIIADTLYYLNQAKERFSERYLGPMAETFLNYVKMVKGIDRENIKEDDLEMDIDLNVKYNYGSQSKEKESLSRGYQDLVDLCLRLSLVDVMFQNESPVLILDDPFVNLDETKVENALNIIKKISEKYQVIYFTCHESRS